MNAVKSFTALGKLYLEASAKVPSMDLNSFLLSKINDSVFESTLIGKATSVGFLEDDVKDELALMVANGILNCKSTRNSDKVIRTYTMASKVEIPDEVLDSKVNGNLICSSDRLKKGPPVKPIDLTIDRSCLTEWVTYAVWNYCKKNPDKSMFSIANAVMDYTDQNGLPDCLKGLTIDFVMERLTRLHKQHWFSTSGTQGKPYLYSLKATIAEPKLTKLELVKVQKDIESKLSSKEKIMAKETTSNTAAKVLPLEQVKEWMEFAIWYVLSVNDKMKMPVLADAVFSLVPYKNESYWNQAKIADRVVLLMKKNYVKNRLGGRGALPTYSLGNFPKPVLTFVPLIEAFNSATGSNMTLPVPKYCEKLSDPIATPLTVPVFNQSVLPLVQTENKVSEEVKVVNEDDPSKQPISTSDSVNQAIWKITSDRQWYTVAEIAVFLSTIGIGGSTPSARISHLYSAEGWFDREIKPGSKAFSYRLKEDIQFPSKVMNTSKDKGNKKPTSLQESNDANESLVQDRFIKDVREILGGSSVNYVILRSELVKRGYSVDYLSTRLKILVNNGTVSKVANETDYRLTNPETTIAEQQEAKFTPKHNVTAADIQRQVGIFKETSEGFSLKPNLDTVKEWAEGSPENVKFEIFTKDIEEILATCPLSYIDLRSRLMEKGYVEDYLSASLTSLIHRKIVSNVNNGTAYALTKNAPPFFVNWDEIDKGIPPGSFQSHLTAHLESVPLIDVRTTVKGISLSKEEVAKLVSEATLLLQALDCCKLTLLNMRVELRHIPLSYDELKEIVKTLS